MAPEVPTKTLAVGRAIRALREDRGWTLRDLAEKAGISYTLLGKKERGELNVKPPERRKFAELFGLTLEEFEATWRASRVDQVRPEGWAKIPVINAAPAGLVEDYEEWGTDSGQGYASIDRGDVEDELAFAAIIVGDSMTPTLHEGDTVIFAPLVSARDRARLADGKVVFVRFSQEPAAPRRGCTVGRFFWSDRTTGAFRLAKDNPRYPEIRAVLVPDQIARISIAVELRSKRGL
jgi:transcriptional regulator with XRE-family HTH domain